MAIKNHNKTQRRKNKVRSKIVGVSVYPRLSVFRSNKHIYAQLINDEKGHTVAALSDKDHTEAKEITKTMRARQVGLQLGKKIVDLKIKQVVFDRGAYKYGGRVKAVADGVREAGVTI